MNDRIPHYVLISKASRDKGTGQWRFVLRHPDGSVALEVQDVEPDAWGERLDLLTVVRALESLDQPSHVTLIGCTRYVEQGIQFGLSDWRETQWRWECFGEMVPVRDADLWQRMDRTLQFHKVECGQRRFDTGHTSLSGNHWSEGEPERNWVDRIAGGNWLKYSCLLPAAWCGFCVEMASSFWQRMIGSRGLVGRQT
jgi:ribonuclease HI